MTTVRQYRQELEALPERMKDLPIDKRGYPVPWFVEWINGEPEFRVMDFRKWRLAVSRPALCWVCGGILGKWKTFVIGPMCGVNRTTSEPGCHLGCAQWSARNCPFMTRPHMIRREDDQISVEKCPAAGGICIPRNPGVTCLWTTDTFKVFSDGLGKGGKLIEIGDPESVEWWAEGRIATRAEVEASVSSGLPLLLEIAKTEEGAEAELYRMHERFKRYLPSEAR